eukprot:366360-Chlamydomonas_euryale.AAC.18
MDSLDVVPVSRVGATQRAGRAGRTRAGMVGCGASATMGARILDFTNPRPKPRPFSLLPYPPPSTIPCASVYTKRFFEGQITKLASSCVVALLVQP